MVLGRWRPSGRPPVGHLKPVVFGQGVNNRLSAPLVYDEFGWPDSRRNAHLGAIGRRLTPRWIGDLKLDDALIKALSTNLPLLIQCRINSCALHS